MEYKYSKQFIQYALLHAVFNTQEVLALHTMYLHHPILQIINIILQMFMCRHIRPTHSIYYAIFMLV